MNKFKLSTHAMVAGAWTVIGLAVTHQATVLPFIAHDKTATAVFLGICTAYLAYSSPKKPQEPPKQV